MNTYLLAYTHSQAPTDGSTCVSTYQPAHIQVYGHAEPHACVHVLTSLLTDLLACIRTSANLTYLTCTFAYFQVTVYIEG